MKIIDCDKKKNNISEINKCLSKLKDKILEHKLFVDKNLNTEEFFKETEENLIYMKSFLHDIDIKVSCAFIDPGVLQYLIVFKYLRKKRKKTIQIVNDFIEELESILSYLDNIDIVDESIPDYLELKVIKKLN